MQPYNSAARGEPSCSSQHSTSEPTVRFFLSNTDLDHDKFIIDGNYYARTNGLTFNKGTFTTNGNLRWTNPVTDPDELKWLQQTLSFENFPQNCTHPTKSSTNELSFNGYQAYKGVPTHYTILKDENNGQLYRIRTAFTTNENFVRITQQNKKTVHTTITEAVKNIVLRARLPAYLSNQTPKIKTSSISAEPAPPIEEKKQETPLKSPPTLDPKTSTQKAAEHNVRIYRENETHISFRDENNQKHRIERGTGNVSRRNKNNFKGKWSNPLPKKEAEPLIQALPDEVKIKLGKEITRPSLFSTAALVSNIFLAILVTLVVARDKVCRESKSGVKRFFTSLGIAFASITLGLLATAKAILQIALLVLVQIATVCGKPKWLVDFKANHLALAPATLLIIGRIAVNSLFRTWKCNTPIFKNVEISPNEKESFNLKKEADLRAKNPCTLLSNASKLAKESWVGSLPL